MIVRGTPEERLLEAQNDLLATALSTPERELLQKAVDAAVLLTDSRIGYIHYVNPDQHSIELCTWSTSTAEYCTAIHDRHYDIEQAGIWADTARQRTPQIHNDYPSVSFRRGLPSGHAELHRHLGVPAMDADGVHLLLGVGNAEHPYGDRDVHIAQSIVDATWQTILRLREYQTLRTRIDLLERNQGVARQLTWEWDPYTDEVVWDARAVDVIPGFRGGVRTWEALRGVLDEQSQQSLEAILTDDDRPGIERLHLRTPDLTLLMQGYWADRPQGHGRVLRGTLLDVSVLSALDKAHERATHDELTGLPNRAWMREELTARLAIVGRRAEDQFAVHFMDLDGFKAINDRLGHLAGDTVLKECAHRLQAQIRAGDVVARYGGDEFLLIQGGPVTADTALIVARRMRTGLLSRPIDCAGEKVTVGISVGVTLCLSPGVPLLDLLSRADAALYAAKAADDHIVLA